MEVSKAEFEVLDAIWQGHPCDAAQVVARLQKKQEWHEKTVKTLLSRLVKKQAISFEKQDRRYLYSPAIERSEYSLKESKGLIDKLFDGRVSPMIANFVKQDALKKDDIEELKAIIAQWEQKND